MARLLRSADVSAQLVWALKLEDGRRRQKLVELVEVLDGERWILFNPTTGEQGRQEDMLLWQRHGSSVLDLAGGRFVDFDPYFDTLYDHYAKGSAWERFPDVEPALRDLRDGGCKLAVVSNFDSRLPGILRDLGIADQLDAIIYSSAVGSAKPDPVIFRRALAALDVDPESAVHVGDSPEADVAGAAAAGPRLFWKILTISSNAALRLSPDHPENNCKASHF